MQELLSSFFTSPLFQSAIVVFIALIVKKMSNTVIDRVVRNVVKSHKYATKLEETKREDTISKVFSTLTGIVIWLVAIGIISSLFNLNLGAVAASLGFLGVVIGLGAQTTIRDYVAGIYILLENQYRVGDIVTLSGGTTGALGTSGVVEDISLRITKLRDLDGTLNIVRNGEASIITNRTYQYSSVVVDINVAYDSDIDLVEKVLNETGEDMMNDETMAKLISEPIQFLRVDKFTDSAIVVKAIGTVQPAEQWTVAGEYRRRILKAFSEAGVTIPLPQIVVHSMHEKTIKK
jgi:small conductance mechanosensitive channel